MKLITNANERYLLIITQTKSDKNNYVTGKTID